MFYLIITRTKPLYHQFKLS